jgi:Flp pilus assembly protein TadG
MRPQNSSRSLSLLARLVRRLRRDERGVTAIEFAIVATPFFMFIFGTIGIGLHFFITNSIEHAVEAAARKIRTGQAQTAGTTVGDFKTEVCAEAASFVECNGKLQIHIQHATEWSGITPAACKDGTSLATAAGAAGDSVSDFSGEESEAVLITVCYQWDLPASIPFITLGDPDLGGASIIQAATTFRTEPYK